VMESFCCNSVAIPGCSNSDPVVIIHVLNEAQLIVVQYSMLFMFCQSCACTAYGL